MARNIKPAKKLFIIGDASVHTGFATVVHNIIEHVYHTWEVHVLALNYFGDYHPIQSKARMYAPSAGNSGDVYGFGRVKPLLAKIKPDVILIVNDPWVATQYIMAIGNDEELSKYTKVLYTPVDAENLKEQFVLPLNAFEHVIAYTQFGKDQLQKRGLIAPVSIIPHGVDTKVFTPMDKHAARTGSNLNHDWYIVQVVDRNQMRKRIDLAVYYFAAWVHSTSKPENVKLYYHGALKDDGWDIVQLCEDNNIRERLIITSPDMTSAQGVPVEMMQYVYNVADVKMSTAGAEGWGLTTHESMACGIPNIVTRHSAYAEWPLGGVAYIEPSNIPFYTVQGLNTKHKIPAMESAIDVLEHVYQNSAYRTELGRRGYEIATKPEFNWKNIAKRFEDVFNTVLLENKK